MSAILQFPKSHAGVRREPTVIQFAFEARDNVAFVRAGDKWLRVPLWLWCEWDGGGHAGVIRDYGLTTYPAPLIEERAIENIELEARTMRRYWRRRNDRHYYNVLGELDRAVLQMEQRQMFERGILYGKSKWEWIAERLSTKFGVNCGWRQAQALYQDAVDNLKQDQARRELRKYAALILALNAVDDAPMIVENVLSAAA